MQEPMLAGLRILDLSRALAGPTCTRMLVEMGAEVIKIEGAPGGDMTRHTAKFRDNVRSLYYVQQNRGKKSVCIDLRQPEGLALVHDLVKHVDVVVENFKPGVINEMGMGFEALQAVKPGIILCSISALGQSGPLASKPGYDYIAQAYSGVTSMIGDPNEPPYIPLMGLGDASTGVHGALAILAALRHRDRTGRGQHLDIGLLDVYYHCHEVNVIMHTGTGGRMTPQRTGRHLTYVCPAGVFRANGRDITIMAFLHHWKDLCAAMNRPDLAADPELDSDAKRLTRRDEIVHTIESWLQSFENPDDAIALMEAHNVPCAPVLSIAETVNEPHLRERGTIRTIEDRLAGSFEAPGFPLRFSDFPEPLPLVAPTLGEHNSEVLTGLLGMDAAEVARLRAAGVLQEKEC
ncbi:MAG: CoA transferase [Gammaproteobacteria bacterium]|nr:CoA transferase [Gammaproteobacteria bacterium]